MSEDITESIKHLLWNFFQNHSFSPNDTRISTRRLSEGGFQRIVAALLLLDRQSITGPSSSPTAKKYAQSFSRFLRSKLYLECAGLISTSQRRSQRFDEEEANAVAEWIVEELSDHVYVRFLWERITDQEQEEAGVRSSQVGGARFVSSTNWTSFSNTVAWALLHDIPHRYLSSQRHRQPRDHNERRSHEETQHTVRQGQANSSIIAESGGVSPRRPSGKARWATPPSSRVPQEQTRTARRNEEDSVQTISPPRPSRRRHVADPHEEEEDRMRDEQHQEQFHAKERKNYEEQSPWRGQLRDTSDRKPSFQQQQEWTTPHQTVPLDKERQRSLSPEVVHLVLSPLQAAEPLVPLYGVERRQQSPVSVLGPVAWSVPPNNEPPHIDSVSSLSRSASPVLLGVSHHPKGNERPQTVVAVDAGRSIGGYSAVGGSGSSWTQFPTLATGSGFVHNSAAGVSALSSRPTTPISFGQSLRDHHHPPTSPTVGGPGGGGTKSHTAPPPLADPVDMLENARHDRNTQRASHSYDHEERRRFSNNNEEKRQPAVHGTVSTPRGGQATPAPSSPPQRANIRSPAPSSANSLQHNDSSTSCSSQHVSRRRVGAEPHPSRRNVDSVEDNATATAWRQVSHSSGTAAKDSFDRLQDVRPRHPPPKTITTTPVTNTSAPATKTATPSYHDPHPHQQQFMLGPFAADAPSLLAIDMEENQRDTRRTSYHSRSEEGERARDRVASSHTRPRGSHTRLMDMGGDSPSSSSSRSSSPSSYSSEEDRRRSRRRSRQNAKPAPLLSPPRHTTTRPVSDPRRSHGQSHKRMDDKRRGSPLMTSHREDRYDQHHHQRPATEYHQPTRATYYHRTEEEEMQSALDDIASTYLVPCHPQGQRTAAPQHHLSLSTMQPRSDKARYGERVPIVAQGKQSPPVWSRLEVPAPPRNEFFVWDKKSSGNVLPRQSVDLLRATHEESTPPRSKRHSDIGSGSKKAHQQRHEMEDKDVPRVRVALADIPPPPSALHFHAKGTLPSRDSVPSTRSTSVASTVSSVTTTTSDSTRSVPLPNPPRSRPRVSLPTSM